MTCTTCGKRYVHERCFNCFPVAESSRKASETFPPCEYVREELEARGWSAASLAEKGKCSLAFAEEIVNGCRRVTRLVAYILATAFGTSQEVWLNLQKAHDDSVRE